MPTPRSFLRLRRMVREFDPDIVHGWMYHAALGALVAAQGRPVIAGIRQSLHDGVGHKHLTRLVIAALGWRSAEAARICYASQVSRVQHEERGYDPARALVIPNGFDCDLFAPSTARRAALRDGLGLGATDIVIGNLGRYHPMKNHLGLLAAFAPVAHADGRLRLVMAGRDVSPANRAIADAVASLGLQGRVHLLGERDDAPDLFGGFDFLVNASRSEAFPNVLGEAMASAVPCVATEVGDSAYIVGDCGMIVPPDAPEALSAAIAAMAALGGSERVALGQRARARVVDRFSLGSVVAAYENLYTTILAESGRKPPKAGGRGH